MAEVFCSEHGHALKMQEMGINVFVMARSLGRKPYKVFAGDRMTCPEPGCSVKIIRTNKQPHYEAHHNRPAPQFRPFVDLFCDER
jgi:hypothetical protein